MRLTGQIIAIGVLVIVLALIQYAGPPGWPAEVSGRIAPIDGDSFRLSGYEVRLVGIDAPEARQECDRGGRSWPCGRDSEAQLRRLIGGRSVRCAVEDRDRFDRLLAVCFVDQTEINRWMVENGWALAYGRYQREEQQAQAARRGIWSGRFERPRHWRERNQAGVTEG
jgi:endonuclease YncB( thermonuclease family)